ncbi:MAG: trypsin-like peptidase domain-containing protein [Candidatus Sumerlaeota bacterium]|nr:trypsin-like peptidase domain-containing protein [Candidatus Sumerlaeota bacterium]
MNRTIRWSLGVLVVMNLILLAVLFLSWRDQQAGPKPGVDEPLLLSALEPVRRLEAAPAPLSATGNVRRTPIVEAAEIASPSVVSINAVVKQVVQEEPFFRDFFSPFLPFGQFEETIPTLGSGIIVGEDGYILTNFHVAENATQMTVTLPDGREFDAQLVDADTYVDIAVLKVNAQGLPVARLGTVADLLLGEWVLAIGNPFGLFDKDPRPSVSIGVVSATNRFFRPDAEPGRAPRVYQDMIQTDAAINPGNSGGPLVNLRGEVIGINTFIFSSSGGSEGIGFAIPVDRAKAIYDEVRKFGRVRTLMLDFQAYTVNQRAARLLRLPRDTVGAIVAKITEDAGPAARAGLQRGDIIVRADSKAIRSWEDLYDYFVTLHVGAKVQFEVLRDGKKVTLNYTVSEGK